MEFPKNLNKNLYMSEHYLICNITGKIRKTTPKYLDQVSKKHSMTYEQYKSNYISREAAVLLNAGKTVDEIRALIPNAPQTSITSEQLAIMRTLNVTKQKGSKLLG